MTIRLHLSHVKTKTQHQPKRDFMNNQIYEAPQSGSADEAESTPQKPGITLKFLLVLFTLLATSIAFLNNFMSMALLGGVQQSRTISYAIGGAIAPIIWGCIIVGLFQIGKRFRNSRSRCKIFMWCQVLFF